MTELTDEEYARKLQDEENLMAGGFDQARAAREHEDALLAQQLSREMSRQRVMGSYPSNVDSSFASRTHGDRSMVSSRSQGNRSQGNRFTIKSGQRTPVRLHNPLTKNHIGEVMYAHYITKTEVRFELCKSPGKSLRVNEYGGVEFSRCAEDDLTSHFKFELTIQGPLYLLCKAYIDKLSITGERSWFLAMTNQGGLQGNSNRGQHAQWVLVAATDPNANNSGNTGVASGSTNNQSHFDRAHVGDNSGPRRADGFEPINDEDMEVNPLIPPEQRDRPNYSSEHAQSEEVSPTHGTHSTAQSVGGNDIANADERVGHPTSLPSDSSGREILPQAVDLSSLYISPRDSSKEIQSKIWRWISSGYGQSFLDSKCPAGKALYKDNPTFLRGLIHRPDWPILARRAKDWKGKHKPSYNSDLAKSVLTKDKLRQFFVDGYTVLPGVCSERMTRRVMRVTTYWLSTRDSTWKSNNGRVHLTGAVKTDPDLLALYYGSPIFHATQMLIGEGDVAPLDYGEISLIFPDMTLSNTDEESDDDFDSDDNDDFTNNNDGADLINIKDMTRKTRHQKEGIAPVVATIADSGDGEDVGELDIKEKHLQKGRFSGLSWIVDGFSKVDDMDMAFSHSPNTLLIAVALSDMPGPDPAQGGLTMINVHEGSHISLMEAMKHQVRCKSTLFSEELRDVATPGYPYSGSEDDVPRGAQGKPNLGPPVPVSLREGDAFICTAKLAITYGLLNPSSGQTANSLAFFRITHADHEAGLKEISVDNVWCEFPLADSILNPAGSSLNSSGSSHINASSISAMPPTQQSASRITADDHSELAAAFSQASSLGAIPAVANPAVNIGQPISSSTGIDLASMGYPQPAPLVPPGGNHVGMMQSSATVTYAGASGNGSIQPLPPPPEENPYPLARHNIGNKEDEYSL